MDTMMDNNWLIYLGILGGVCAGAFIAFRKKGGVQAEIRGPAGTGVKITAADPTPPAAQPGHVAKGLQAVGSGTIQQAGAGQHLASDIHVGGDLTVSQGDDPKKT